MINDFGQLFFDVGIRFRQSSEDATFGILDPNEEANAGVDNEEVTFAHGLAKCHFVAGVK